LVLSSVYGAVLVSLIYLLNNIRNMHAHKKEVISVICSKFDWWLSCCYFDGMSAK